MKTSKVTGVTQHSFRQKFYSSKRNAKPLQCNPHVLKAVFSFLIFRQITDTQQNKQLTVSCFKRKIVMSNCFYYYAVIFWPNKTIIGLCRMGSSNGENYKTNVKYMLQIPVGVT